MLPYRDSRITKYALIVFFLVVAAYGYYEARGILFGPRISVNSEITEVHDPFIVIKGQADRISELHMNGKAITVTEQGAFEEPYLLSEGLNRIVLDAEDKYGRSRQEVLQIVYIPTSTPPTPVLETTVTAVEDATSSTTATTTEQ